MYAFLVSPRHTFLETTKHSGTNTILSRGSRRKLLYSSLMNELIRIEWVSEWAIAIRLPNKLMDVTHPWAKRKGTIPISNKARNRSLASARDLIWSFFGRFLGPIFWFSSIYSWVDHCVFYEKRKADNGREKWISVAYLLSLRYQQLLWLTFLRKSG